MPEQGKLMSVVFSGGNGVFTNAATLEVNGLQLIAKIMRHLTPDYETHLVSTLRWTLPSEDKL